MHVWCLCGGRGSQQTLGVMTSVKMGGGGRMGHSDRGSICACVNMMGSRFENHLWGCVASGEE